MKKSLIIILTIAMLFSMALAGCGTDTTTSPGGETTADGDTDTTTTTEGATDDDTDAPDVTEYSQSPMLDDMDLPPVAERLPLEPKLINEIPADQMDYENGKYGGTLRTVRMSPLWDAVVWTVLEEPLLNSPGRLGEEITPNIAKSFEANANMSEFTFTLREGMKWSDGQPLTTKDVEFFYESVLKNEQITPSWPQWLRTGAQVSGSPMTLEVVDEYTFKYIFDGPYGGFLLNLTTVGFHSLINPAHYMSEYHIDFADADELEALVEEFGYEPGEWYNLYNFVRPTTWDNGRITAMTTPHLGPYILAQDGEPRVFERNPYYFKVDGAGQQLPYIDRINSTFVSDMETAGVQILAGEIDFAYEWVPLDKVALYKENEERGGYKLLTNTMLHRTAADIFFNFTYDDDTWREVVRDIRFRQALNIAIDKADLVDTVYYGFAEPSPMQGTELDIDRANSILDEMGMAKGSDGYRMSPSGEPFTIEFSYSDWMTQYSPTAQLVAEQWRLLGLRINLRQLDNSLLDTMVNANEVQVSVAFTHGPVFAMWDDWSFSRWGRLWWLYYSTGGVEGEEPPAEVVEFYDTVFSIRTENPSTVMNIREDLRRQMGEHLWYFLPVENVTQLSLINAKLRNFPDAGYLLANSFAAEQYWFDE